MIAVFLSLFRHEWRPSWFLPAAPRVHAKPALPESATRNAETLRNWDGFAIDIEEARAFRDLEDRLGRLRRKRDWPTENGGPLTAEEADLGALIRNRAAQFVCPADYGLQDAAKDSDRLHQLNCKRLSPPSCGGRELTGGDNDEEAYLSVRLAAYRHSQEGRDRYRITQLEVYRSYLNPDEEAELDRLRSKYPKDPETVEHESTRRHVDPARWDGPATPARNEVVN